jgi:hypothetical protein
MDEDPNAQYMFTGEYDPSIYYSTTTDTWNAYDVPLEYSATEKEPTTYFTSAAVSGDAIAYEKEASVDQDNDEQEIGEGAVPYPEGYIPSVTQALIQKQQEARKYTQEAKPQPREHVMKESKRIIRSAGGEVWEDLTLNEWDADDYRIFVGDLGVEVSDNTLTQAFNKYPSFLRARVVRDKKSHRAKGYGFVSFKDPNDFVRALKEMNGKYIGSRPVKLRKSTWDERNISKNQLRKIQGHAGPVKKKAKVPLLNEK